VPDRPKIHEKRRVKLLKRHRVIAFCLIFRKNVVFLRVFRRIFKIRRKLEGDFQKNVQFLRAFFSFSLIFRAIAALSPGSVVRPNFATSRNNHKRRELSSDRRHAAEMSSNSHVL